VAHHCAFVVTGTSAAPRGGRRARRRDVDQPEARSLETSCLHGRLSAV